MSMVPINKRIAKPGDVSNRWIDDKSSATE